MFGDDFPYFKRRSAPIIYLDLRYHQLSNALAPLLLNVYSGGLLAPTRVLHHLVAAILADHQGCYVTLRLLVLR